jgi:drug/metabolite transporter (DMT)-like permease
MKAATKAHLALLGTNIFFAINYTAIKLLVNAGLAKPFGLNLVRVGLTAILLWILYFIQPVREKIPRKDYGRLALCALTGIAINQLLFVKGLSLTYSIHASLLMLSTPILITIFAAIVLKEKPGLMKIAGLFLGITGATILLVSGEKGSHAPNVFLGDTLVLINAVSYTLYFVLVRPLMKIYNPVQVIRMIFSFGFFMVLPFCWGEFSETEWSRYEFMDFFLLGLITIGGTFLAYLFNVYGIKILGASMAGTYIYSQPVFAASIAMLFLGEKLDLYKIIAALLIATGVYLSNKSQNDS